MLFGCIENMIDSINFARSTRICSNDPDSDSAPVSPPVSAPVTAPDPDDEIRGCDCNTSDRPKKLTFEFVKETCVGSTTEQWQQRRGYNRKGRMLRRTQFHVHGERFDTFRDGDTVRDVTSKGGRSKSSQLKMTRRRGLGKHGRGKGKGSSTKYQDSVPVAAPVPVPAPTPPVAPPTVPISVDDQDNIIHHSGTDIDTDVSLKSNTCVDGQYPTNLSFDNGPYNIEIKCSGNRLRKLFDSTVAEGEYIVLDPIPDAILSVEVWDKDGDLVQQSWIDPTCAETSLWRGERFGALVLTGLEF